MPQITVSEFGEPENLEVTSSPSDIEPGQGEVLIEVAAAGVNFADMLMVTGQYQFPTPLPATPGSELSGTVVAVGSRVTRVAVGDRVMALVPQGAFADRVVAPEQLTVALPDGLDLVTAAAAPISYATAHTALVRHGRLRAGQTVVVTGAGGSVGHATAELARRFGAQVIAVQNAGESNSSSAHHTLSVADLPGESLTKEILQLTHGQGAELAVDVVGGELFETLVPAMAFSGTILTVGFASGVIPEVGLATLLTRTLTVAGFDMGHYMRKRHGDLAAALDDVVTQVAAGTLRPRYDRTLPMADAPKVLAAIQRGEARGKTVLQNSTTAR